MEDHLFFNGWEPLIRILVIGTASYIVLILLLRTAGKRTLSRMNAYDMVITMALGSIMAKVLLTRDQSMAESITAMCLLIGLQYGLSVAMCRCKKLRYFISPKPAVLFHEGEYVTHIKKERVDKDEILAAVHARGVPDLTYIDAVILGANGDLSVLLKPEYIGAPVLATPKRPGGI